MHRRAYLAALACAGLAGCSGPRPIASGTEEWSVPVGDHESVSLEFGVPATIEYAVEVHEGRPVDVLVLREARFEAFEAGNLSENAPKSTLQDAESDSANANLLPGTWYLVVDAAGQNGDAPAQSTTVTLSYELTRYIPYGSGRHDDSGPSSR